jgi:hypothetical protein
MLELSMLTCSDKTQYNIRLTLKYAACDSSLRIVVLLVVEIQLGSISPVISPLSTHIPSCAVCIAARLMVSACRSMPLGLAHLVMRSIR